MKIVSPRSKVLLFMSTEIGGFTSRSSEYTDGTPIKQYETIEKDKIINNDFPLVYIPNNHEKFFSIYRLSEKKITFLYEFYVISKKSIKETIKFG